MFGALRRFFKPRQQQLELEPEELGLPQPDEPLAVIGDVHGCLDLLVSLLEKIDARGVSRVVTVGDYVDRGEYSAGTLAHLRDEMMFDPSRFVCLMGNHEKMLLDFLDRPVERGQRWLRNGGLQTLASYGVGGVTESGDKDSLLLARDAFRKALPEGLETWIRGLPLSFSSGNLWVVHAAADPSRNMMDQDERTLLWGHKHFLSTSRADGIWIAHGHTVTDLPEMRLSRIPTDTGAYFSGKLTAAVISPTGNVEFLQS